MGRARRDRGPGTDLTIATQQASASRAEKITRGTASMATDVQRATRRRRRRVAHNVATGARGLRTLVAKSVREDADVEADESAHAARTDLRVATAIRPSRSASGAPSRSKTTAPNHDDSATNCKRLCTRHGALRNAADANLASFVAAIDPARDAG